MPNIKNIQVWACVGNGKVNKETKRKFVAPGMTQKIEFASMKVQDFSIQDYSNPTPPLY